MNTHLIDAELVVFARRGDLPLPERRGAHVAQCPRCRALLADFRLLREHVASEPLAPGREALARVFALAERRPPTADANRFRLARLLHDSGPELLAAGMRAAGAVREQLWRIPGAEVDIRIQPSGLGAPGRLHGQMFPLTSGAASEDGSVWLVERGRRPVWALLDADGEFELPAPTGMSWQLWIEWRGVHTRLESR